VIVHICSDANLSGGWEFNGDDYFRIAAGYAAHATGYANGDFDYNGRIDAGRYFVIDSQLRQKNSGVFMNAANRGRKLAARLGGSRKPRHWRSSSCRSPAS